MKRIVCAGLMLVLITGVAFADGLFNPQMKSNMVKQLEASIVSQQEQVKEIQANKTSAADKQIANIDTQVSRLRDQIEYLNDKKADIQANKTKAADDEIAQLQKSIQNKQNLMAQLQQ